MIIRYQTWRRVTRVGSILAFPVVLFLFVRPDWGVWTHRLEIATYIFMFSLGGLGALLAVLTRVGIVRIIYSESDKQSKDYRLAKTVAEREQSQQHRFSDTYYESLGVESPNQKDPDDTPVA